ncbi:MobF family relaxase [Paludisphaera borealis]|uniref:Multifunctional conjugation protein TraI n=1 Tax=Paludisphaera borealis TaxID=1387353 RepID=A0A1U7CI49_9BACT|nr:MobF family relaxase [Paludisphaera borealis]APW58620.1 Multifunctional conjugation protein TraI [Paludisphaera borealis]
MLRMKPVGKGERGARRAELYYEKSDAGYYRAEGELHSEWIGKSGDMLGLTGQKPDYEHFKRLIRGLDPHTGEQLTARLRDDRIAAWDLTASMPKGPTLAIERGDTRVLDAFRESYREAFSMVERYATTRVRIDGRQDDRVTGNLLAYAIEHDETRPVEDENLPEDHPWRIMPLPDRHAHLVVPNETWDDVEQRWKAVKFRPIMDLRKYFDRSFDAIFAAKLSGLGYEIETRLKDDGKGKAGYYSWDIKGMPASVIERLSRRTQEVKRLEREIVAGRKALDPYAPDHLSPVERDRLGATSRRTKRDDLTSDDCHDYWASLISEEEGRQIDDTIGRARLGLNPKSPSLAAKAADFSMRHHFEKESALPIEQLVTTALEQSMGSATPDDIERELARQGVIVVDKDGRRLATTKQLMEEEDGLAAFAADGRGMVAAIGVEEGLTRKLETGETLNDGQWEAARGLLESQNRVNVVLGPAGAGKSKLLRKFDEGATLAGETVTYLGTTATAVKVLKKDGFEETQTVARFLLDEKMQQAAAGGRVVIDETSILGHADAAKLFAVARKHDLKLIFVGDPMQHGSIPRGAFLRLLTDYGHVKPFRLTEILRQKDPEYRAAAQSLSEGKSLAGFDALDKLGWVEEIDHGQDRYTHMAADYVQALQSGTAWNDVLIVAPTHREAGHITGEIRAQLREAGKLGDDEREFNRLAAVDTSEAERGEAATYRAGDVLVFHQNAKGGFTKGDRLKVTDPAAVPVEHADKFALFREEAIRLAAGDVIRFTSTVRTLGKDHVIKNGDAHAVAGFTDAGNIRLDNGWVVARDAGHFRQGFVETSIGSQGRTVQQVILGMSAEAGRAAINMQQLYVSASRASGRLRLYTDDKADIRDAIQKDSQKRLALDLKAVLPRETKREERRIDGIARRQRASALNRMRAAWKRASRPLTPKPPTPPLSHAARIMQQERSYGHER